MGANKPVPVVIIPPVRLIGVPKNHGRIGSMQGSWDPEILVSVINTLGIPVEEDLSGIGMEIINVVIHMECDSDAS